MRFCVLGSGSEGNAYVAESGETTLLIDCGFSLASLVRRMASRHISPADVDAVVISHEHGDHVAGMAALLREYDIPCYLSAGTARVLGIGAEWRCLTAGKAAVVGDLQIHPVPVPHDGEEVLQFVIEDKDGRRLAVFTDLGHATPAVCRALADADAMILECNYDEEMLERSPYPYPLKRRIAGRYGHLSNTNSAALLADSKNGKRRQVVAAHLSRKNNCPQRVVEVLTAADDLAHVTVADQQSGTCWLSVGKV